MSYPDLLSIRVQCSPGFDWWYVNTQLFVLVLCVKIKGIDLFLSDAHEAILLVECVCVCMSSSGEATWEQNSQSLSSCWTLSSCLSSSVCLVNHSIVNAPFLICTFKFLSCNSSALSCCSVGCVLYVFVMFVFCFLYSRCHQWSVKCYLSLSSNLSFLKTTLIVHTTCYFSCRTISHVLVVNMDLS